MFDLQAARSWAGAVLAAAVVALSGCASVAQDPARQAPAANESVVAVTITGNTSQVTAMDALEILGEVVTEDLDQVERLRTGQAHDVLGQDVEGADPLRL